MILPRRSILAGGAALGLSACGSPSKFKAYTGPQVTRVQVFKGDRRMYLLSGTEVLKDYKIKLGFTAEGPKQFEGDGKTPEGAYVIDRKNPQSSFHLSLGVSYPNAEDRAFAEEMGKSPGGEIFIHGGPSRAQRRRATSSDWTAGCIAVSDRQIETIYAMIDVGTPIDIFA